MVRPLRTAAWRFLKMLQMELPYDSEIPLPGVYPKKPKTLIRKNVCSPLFTAASLTIAKLRKQPECPSLAEWIKKQWYICTMKYYSTIKKNGILPFVTTWMGPEGVRLRETSQAEKDKCDRTPLG